MSLVLASPAELAQLLAARVKALRLLRGWSQVEVAARAGMTLASYRRFERTGEVALLSFLRLVIVLDATKQLEPFLQPPMPRTLDQAIAVPKLRQRAPRQRRT